jgi:hypothetical protein
MKKKVRCVFIFLCCCGFCNAQQVVSSGGFEVKSDISVNWILGGSLSVIPTISTGPAIRSQESIEESEISLKVYPTPATDFINIEITPADTTRYILDLYNDTGMKILDQVVSNQPLIQVNISDIPSGIYFLKVFLPDNNQPLKVEKIVKSKIKPL